MVLDSALVSGETPGEEKGAGGISIISLGNVFGGKCQGVRAPTGDFMYDWLYLMWRPVRTGGRRHGASMGPSQGPEFPIPHIIDSLLTTQISVHASAPILIEGTLPAVCQGIVFAQGARYWECP